MKDAIELWLPIIISALALGLTGYFNLRTQAMERHAARLAREKDLHDWARQVGEAYFLLRSGDAADRKKAVARLSILVDYGRLFFPNERTVSAMQVSATGRRSSVLDPLVETCIRCGQDTPFDDAKAQQDWRVFVDQLGSRTTAFAIDTSPEAEGRKRYINR